MTRTVQLTLFATAREAVGASRLERAVPSTGVRLDTLLESIAEEHPRLRPILRNARVARNGEYVVGKRLRVRPGDEIAIHPPYSGG